MNLPLEPYLMKDDTDRHGEGCDCGLCDARGRSFGVGFYDKGNVQWREYAPTEHMAWLKAIAKCDKEEIEFCYRKSFMVHLSVLVTVEWDLENPGPDSEEELKAYLAEGARDTFEWAEGVHDYVDRIEPV